MCSKYRFLFFPAKVQCIFKVRLVTVSFIPKEMSKHLKEKFSEMEGRRTHVNGWYFMIIACISWYFMIIANSALRASLAIYHLISNARL